MDEAIDELSNKKVDPALKQDCPALPLYESTELREIGVHTVGIIYQYRECSAKMHELIEAVNERGL